MSRYITTAHILYQCIEVLESLLDGSIEVMQDGETGDLLFKQQSFAHIDVDNLEISINDFREQFINPAVAYLFNEIRDKYLQLKDKGNVKIFFEPLKLPQQIDCHIVTIKNGVSARIIKQYDDKSDSTFCRLDALYSFISII